MARHCLQLLEPVHLAEVPGALDVVWVDSHLQFPRSEPGGSEEEAKLSVVFLSLLCRPADAVPLMSLTQLLPTLRVSRQRICGDEPARGLFDELRDRDFEHLGVVLVLDDDRLDDGVAQACVDAVRSSDLDAQTLVVAVSAHPGRWCALRGVDGFVRSECRSINATGTLVCVALATLIAPELMSCLDAEDIRPALGSFNSPSVVIEAAWHANSCSLTMSAKARELAADSSRVALFVCAGVGQQARGGHIVGEWPSQDRQDLHAVYQTAYDLVDNSAFRSGSAYVIALCAT